MRCCCIGELVRFVGGIVRWCESRRVVTPWLAAPGQQVPALLTCPCFSEVLEECMADDVTL